MTQEQEPSKTPSHAADYIIDAENATEMARLLQQDRLFTKALGIVPESIDVSEITEVLDIACGPGGWLLDLVSQSAHLYGVGIDTSSQMISYASSMRSKQLRERVHFLLMDAREPLDFADDRFDLVNARLIGFFPPELWPKLVGEMLRVTAPGGTIRLTETEMSVSNSPALEQEHAWFFQSLWKAGQSFSSNGERLTLTAMLAPLLRRAGCCQVQTRAYAIEWSAGTSAHTALRENVLVGFKLMEPFYLATGVATPAQIEQTYAQMAREVYHPDFAAVQYLLSATGQKPST